MGKSDDLNTLLDQARTAGWRIEQGAKHWKCYSPNGKAIVVIPRTTSDWRMIRNARAAIRRATMRPQ